MALNYGYEKPSYTEHRKEATRKALESINRGTYSQDVATVRAGGTWKGSSSGSSSKRSSGGSRSSSKRRRARETAARKAREQKAREVKAAEQKRLQEIKTQAEAQRVAAQQQKLLLAGARRSRQVVRNREGKVVRTQYTVQGMGQKIVTQKDLTTGKIYVRTYNQGRLSGGFSEQREKAAQQKQQVQAAKQKDPRLTGEVQIATKSKGLAGLSQSINQARGSLRQSGAASKYGIGGAKLVGYAFLGGVVDTVQGFVDLPKTLSYLARNPSEIKNIPSQIAKSGEQFGYVLSTSPGEGIAYVGGSYVGLKGTSSALKGLGRVKGSVVARLNPKFVGTPKVGKTFNIKVGGGRTVKIKIVNKMPRASLNRQVALQGKRVNAISSQADSLVGAIRRGKVVRKPIAGTRKFNAQTERLLKKFDSGSITKKEIYDLDLMLRSQGTKGLLERSFFADPSGKIRPSRLGVVKEGKTKLMDYLSEDITFKKPKPQILLFDDIQVSKFPKNLQGVAKKLRTGKTLTKAEGNALLEWQLKKSGKFKPLGFVSQEAELTLAPGELIKRVKKVGVTRINGKNIPIVKAKVYRPTGTTKTLLTKYQKGTLTAAERTRLNKLLKQQTGFNYGVSSGTARGRYVSIKRIGLSSSGKIVGSVRKVRSSVARGSSRVKKTSSVRKGSSSIRKSGSSAKKGSSSKRKGGSSRKKGGSSGRSTGKSSRGGSSGISRGGSRGGSSKISKKIVPTIRVPKKFKTTKLTKPVQTYYVVEKVRGKFKKLYPKPLKANHARDFAVYQIDNRLSKTAFLIPLGKRKVVVSPPKSIQGYYSKNSRKVRPYKIRYGAKKLMVNGYIEKRKYSFDKPLERKSTRRVAVKRKVRKTTTKRPVKRKPVKRTLTAAQRRTMMRNMAKARAVRMRNLRKKR